MTRASIQTLAKDIRAGHLTSCDLVEQCLASITERDPVLNAFIAVLADDARKQAQEADAAISRGNDRGPLHGIPISLKDIIDVSGTATTAASRVRNGHRATADAAVVTRLREAGAIVIGKCNLHEFAFGTTGEDSAFGPTRNPYAEDHIAGGSSSGSAVSVATGMAVASIGTDTGGSIRIPASACGVVGLKPTFGDVSVDGIIPLAPSLDHVGPLTRVVADAAIIHQVIKDHRIDKFSPAGGSLRQTRFGVPRRYFLDNIDAAVGELFECAVRRLDAAGGHVTDVDIPHAADTAAVYLHTQLSEAATYHRPMLDTKAEAYCPSVRARLELGRYVLAEDYLLAQRGREILRREVDAALAETEVLLLPTLPIIPPKIGVTMTEAGGKRDSVRALTLRLTQLFDLTGHPAISIPCGTAEGLPVGIQLVGRRNATDALLTLAAQFEDVIRD